MGSNVLIAVKADGVDLAVCLMGLAWLVGLDGASWFVGFCRCCWPAPSVDTVLNRFNGFGLSRAGGQDFFRYVVVG